MNYQIVMKLTTKLGYQLAMSGAETYRIEESINRILRTYQIKGESFAVPNYMMVTLIDDQGRPITQMRRIGYHGTDLEAVEKLTGLSRHICSASPDPALALQWLEETIKGIKHYSPPMVLLGDSIGAAGFALFFGGCFTDMILAGFCGLVVGIVSQTMERFKSNSFFTTMAASFFMAMLAYGLGALGIARNPDSLVIGGLMLLVPGLLFTNAMRDIIYGDTNSGIIRVFQVILIGVANAVGTAAAWNIFSRYLGTPIGVSIFRHPLWLQCLGAGIGCTGFAFVFNIHGPGGLLCSLGGILAWAVYALALELGCSPIEGYFWGAAFASAYAECMARIRKYPAISYLVFSIFPLIPGSDVYYTMNYAVQGDMEMFAGHGMFTAAVAGVIAVGILLVSTLVRMYTSWKFEHRK